MYNQPVLDLIEHKPPNMGLLVVLDDEIKLADSSDQRFLEKISKQHQVRLQVDVSHPVLDPGNVSMVFLFY